MTTTLTVEATRSGTITRACARTMNRTLRARGYGDLATLSGSATVDFALITAHVADLDVRVVDAATLSGADKGRHTREVNRSKVAQVRREARKDGHLGEECSVCERAGLVA